jgi:hypothetical protein
MPPPLDPKEITGLFQWQQERRRPDGQFAYPMPGFGPGGRITLWLPASKASTAWHVRDGRPVQETVEAEIDPETERLRQEILGAARSVGIGLITLPGVFYEYAARLIRRNYNVSDADLEYALFGGGQDWRREMVTHVLGGADMVKLLADAAEIRELNGQTAGEAYAIAKEREADAAVEAAEASAIFNPPPRTGRAWWRPSTWFGGSER